MIYEFIKRSFIILLVIFASLFVIHGVAYGTATEATVDTNISEDSYGGSAWGRQRQVVFSSTAAGENGCADLRGYAYCTIKYDISGTINFDLDWSISDTYDASFVASEVDDLAADGVRNTAVDGLYLCYDMDTCTTCTLALTVTCVNYGNEK